MFIFESSDPVNKLAFNTSLPPMLAGSLRMFILFIFLIQFFKFGISDKKYFFHLMGFSLIMDFGVIKLICIIIMKKHQTKLGQFMILKLI